MSGHVLVVSRSFALLASLAYVASLGYFVYSYAQFGTPVGPWHSGAWTTVLQNVLLFSVFVAHHVVLARPGPKQSLRQLVPPHLHRSGYVAGAALLFATTLMLWQPVPGVAWELRGPWFLVGEAICLSGVVLIGLSLARVDLPAFVGLRQGLGLPYAPTDDLNTEGPYRFVRHPVYLGWILLVWTLPVMTGTRLVFAAISTAYLVLVIPIEERSFRRALGAEYEAYARKVRWRIVPGVY